jgi:hypothetical protein
MSRFPLRIITAFPIIGRIRQSNIKQAVGPIFLPDRFAITEQTHTTAVRNSNAIPKMSLKINLAEKAVLL